ncbi:MAG TPA: hypothetical protein VJN94_04480 [Candidatus Binataceae bacterium]|nr:hypothetical protein [Candidatus Binataceae bacterium]
MADIDDVQSVFQAAVNAFNDHELTNLMSYMDQEATVYSISGKLAYHPKHAVRAYFKEQFADNPNFQPNTMTPNPQFNPTGDPVSATISDGAIWTDTNHTYKLNYTFTLVKRGAGSNTPVWLFSVMWGS